MTWVSKVEKAIELADTLDDIEYIEDRIDNSPDRPNYRTKEGREIRESLFERCNDRAYELIEGGEEPF